MAQWIGIRLGSLALILAVLFTTALPAAVTQASPDTYVIPAVSLLWDRQRPETHVYAAHMGPRSLALDSYLTDYVAFGGSHLYLYIDDGNTPYVQTVDPAWGVGLYPALVLDASNHPKISYLDQLNFALKYASYNGTSWSLETVDTLGIDDGDSSLALYDSALGQMPGISYYAWEGGKGVLKYAYKTCSPFPCHWVRETVDSTSLNVNYIGERSALRFDSSGKEVIAYSVSDHNNINNLMVAYRNSGGTWTKYQLDSTVGMDSISMTSSGNAFYVSYGKLNSVTGHVDPFVAMSTSAGVNFSAPQDVDKSDREKANVTSIDLDPSGVPYVAYGSGLESSSERLMIAHKVSSGGNCPSDLSLWSCEVAQGDTGQRVYPADLSLAVGANGAPFIVYTNIVGGDDNFRLNYQIGANQWITALISASESRGSATSLVLDSTGRAHIAYVGSSQGLFYSVESVTGTWQTDLIANGADGFNNTTITLSLAIDSPSNTPYIAFANSGAVTVAHPVMVGGNCGPGNLWLCDRISDYMSNIDEYIAIGLYGHIPYVIYHDNVAKSLVMARYVISGGSGCASGNSAWTCFTLDSPASGETNTGLNAVMSVDSLGQAAIAYTSLTDTNLRKVEVITAPVVSLTSAQSAAPITLLNDIGYSAGGYLDITNTGHPRISYYASNVAAIGIGYAEYVGSGGHNCTTSAWNCELLVKSSDVGRYPLPQHTAIAADASGNVAISYAGGGSPYFVNLHLLRYVGAGGNLAGGRWQWQRVDHVGDVGVDSSVALDASGLPRISYLDLTSGHLLYATSELGFYLPVVKK